MDLEALLRKLLGYAYSLLSDEKKRNLIDDYFKDINYNLCRLSIGSCDFSLSSYSYSRKSDLSDFNIEKDFEYVMPLIKDILKINPNIKFLASPWSPPRFMKNNKLLSYGCKLLSSYKATYAEYLSKYILAYKNCGIKIDYITIQNEPNAIQSWESCLFSENDEVDFLINYLYPAFHKNNIDTKILIYDHNKDKLFIRASKEFKNKKALEYAARNCISLVYG